MATNFLFSGGRMKCDNCLSPDFRMWLNRTLDGRPYFKCFNCKHNWTCGMDGEPYYTNCINRQKRKKPHEPNYVMYVREKYD
jgi:hypothetical protein